MLCILKRDRQSERGRDRQRDRGIDRVREGERHEWIKIKKPKSRRKREGEREIHELINVCKRLGNKETQIKI